MSSRCSESCLLLFELTDESYCGVKSCLFATILPRVSALTRLSLNVAFWCPLTRLNARARAHTHTGRLPAAQNHRDKELADVHIYLKGEQLLYVHDKKRS